MPSKIHNIVLSQYLQRYLTKIFIEPGIQKLSIKKIKLDLLYPISGKTLFFYLKKKILILNVITEFPKIKCSAILTKSYKRPFKVFKNIYNIYFLVGKQITPKIKNSFCFSLTKVLDLCCLHQEWCTSNVKGQRSLNVPPLAPEVSSATLAQVQGKSSKKLQCLSCTCARVALLTSGARGGINNPYYLKEKFLQNLYFICSYLTKKNSSKNIYNTFSIYQLEQDTLYVSSSFKEKTGINYVLSKKLFSRKLQFSQNHSFFISKFQLIRPLFFITRFDTFYVCESLKLPTSPDKSNLQVKFLRNRLRKQILPSIRVLLNPQIDIIVCNFSESVYNL